MKLNDLTSRAGEWLRGNGPMSEIVISSRIRLARNLAGHRFLARASQHFPPEAEVEQAELQPCTSCGAPTSAEVCAFCRLVATAAAHEPVPVELVAGGRGRR